MMTRAGRVLGSGPPPSTDPEQRAGAGRTARSRDRALANPSETASHPNVLNPAVPVSLPIPRRRLRQERVSWRALELGPSSRRRHPLLSSSAPRSSLSSCPRGIESFYYHRPIQSIIASSRLLLQAHPRAFTLYSASLQA